MAHVTKVPQEKVTANAAVVVGAPGSVAFQAPAPAASPKVTADDVRLGFARLAANRWKMAQTTAAQRIQRIRRLRDALLTRREELCQALYEDYRKPAAEVEVTEIFPVVSECNHAIKHLAAWMKPQRASTPIALLGTRSEVRYEPRGVVLILAPWNYPFQLLVNPLIAALAAGNVVAVRPSAKVPQTAKFIARFLRDLFPAEEVAVFEGDHSVSDALLELPFDHVFFTGSPRIGKKVMAAAAKHLASVTLELGGKSPAIVDESADVSLAAERILWGKLINAGQTCVAPDYLMIHESRLAEFLAEAKRVLTHRYGGTEEARQKSPNFCRLVSEDHYRGLTKLLESAVAAGAKVAVGGTSSAEERYLAPTLLTDVTDSNPIMQEEIFGPILPILTFKDLGQAIDSVRSRPKPLALYVFSRDRHATARVLSETTAGGTCVNATLIHLGNADLPFGGVGNSGLGNYHGFYGFRTCSHERAVVTQRVPDLVKSFYPPYTPTVLSLIRALIKYGA